MWNPLKEATAHVHLFESRTLRIDHQRAAVLICYEQIIPWPMIHAAFERPTVLVAIANDHWAQGTPIPGFQRACVRSWAALLHLPFILATNE
jgi:apolipoprotein N-acyltransferase